MQTREKEVEKRLVNAVKAAGGIAYKFVSPGNAGVPDRIVVTKDGRVIFVELKTEIGKLSGEQKAQIRKLDELKQTVIVLYGKEDVDDFVRDFIDGI